MACEIKLKKNQTAIQRKAEVRKAVKGLEQALAMKSIKPVIGPQGAIAFPGWNASDRDGVSDACAFRIIGQDGSALAKMAIAAAEQMAGRTVSKTAMAQGHHSHDGGKTWDKH